MKTRNYRHGQTSFKAYEKKVGNGWEIGLLMGGKKLFVGNFIHSAEANAFWVKLNQQIRSFGKRYRFPKVKASSWYGKFLADHVYTNYYSFINKVLSAHSARINRSKVQNLRKWKKIAKTAKKTPRTTTQRNVYLKAA